MAELKESAKNCILLRLRQGRKCPEFPEGLSPEAELSLKPRSSFRLSLSSICLLDLQCRVQRMGPETEDGSGDERTIGLGQWRNKRNGFRNGDAKAEAHHLFAAAITIGHQPRDLRDHTCAITLLHSTEVQQEWHRAETQGGQVGVLTGGSGGESTSWSFSASRDDRHWLMATFASKPAMEPLSDCFPGHHISL